MLNHPRVQQFIQLVDSWNGGGFVEYMLWRAVEGNPIGIWAFTEVVSVETMELLRTLRDELGIWPFWAADVGGWDVVSVEPWRRHAAEVTLNDLIMRARTPA